MLNCSKTSDIWLQETQRNRLHLHAAARFGARKAILKCMSKLHTCTGASVHLPCIVLTELAEGDQAQSRRRLLGVQQQQQCCSAEQSKPKGGKQSKTDLSRHEQKDASCTTDADLQLIMHCTGAGSRLLQLGHCFL